MDNAESKLSPSGRSLGTVVSFPSIDVLPTETLLHVFSYLTVPELLCLRLVCRRMYAVLSDPATWTRAVWPNFKRGQPKEFTVFLNLCHSSLRTLILGGDVTMAHMTRIRKRCVALDRLVITKWVSSISLLDVLPKVPHLSVTSCYLDVLKEAIKKHPHLQSLEFVSPPLKPIYISWWQAFLSAWASNGFKPKYVVIFKSVSYNGDERGYIWYHHRLQEFVTSPPPAASLSWFCRSRGPLGLTIEAPFLQVNVGPRASPMDAPAVSTLPAHAGLFVVRLGRSPQGELTACVEQQLQPTMIPDCLSVPFSQCAPVLSCLDLSFLTLPAGALSCISQHCPLLRQLSLAESIIPDLEDGLNSLADECKWLSGIDLYFDAEFPYSRLTVWKPIGRVHSLRYLHVDGSVFMEISENRESDITSGPRYRVSRVPTVNVEVCREVMKTIRQLSNVCGLHVSDFHHGDVNKRYLDDLLHVNLLSHVSCFHSLRYLKIDLTPPQYRDNPTGVNMYNVSISRCTLPGMGELLRTCSYLQYLSITAYNVRLPEDPLVYSRLLQLQLKTFVTDANERFFNALSSAQDLTVLCLQLRSFSHPAVLGILPKFPKLTSCHIVASIRFTVNARKKLKAALRNHPNAPLNAFFATEPTDCCHPDLSDLFII